MKWFQVTKSAWITEVDPSGQQVSVPSHGVLVRIGRLRLNLITWTVPS